MIAPSPFLTTPKYNPLHQDIPHEGEGKRKKTLIKITQLKLKNLGEGR
jgi:hypothetical protein